jgi:cytochrome c-type biogenesis protein CcmH/NrfG
MGKRAISSWTQMTSHNTSEKNRRNLVEAVKSTRFRNIKKSSRKKRT